MGMIPKNMAYASKKSQPQNQSLAMEENSNIDTDNAIEDGQTNDLQNTMPTASDMEDATKENSIVQILSTNPEDAGEPVRVMPSPPTTTYAKDIHYPQTTLHGIFSSKEIFF